MNKTFARMPSAMSENSMKNVKEPSGISTARMLAAEYASDARADFSRAFTTAVIQGLWRKKCKQIEYKSPLLRPWVFAPKLSHVIQTAGERLGSELADVPLELALSSIGSIYTSAMDPHDRAASGAYYTPRPLTDALIDMIESQGIDITSSSFVDPASGGGALLTGVVSRILFRMPRSPKRAFDLISKNIRGFEFDPFAAWISQIALELVMLPVSKKIKQRLPTLIEICDSLKQVQPNQRKFDVVIGNPPYGKLKLDPADRIRFARSLHGHANMYGLFTHASLDWVKDGGVIAFVTPTSFLGGMYFKGLRELMAVEAPPKEFAFVAARKDVFDGVLQETMLSTYCKASNADAVRVSAINSLGRIPSRTSIGKFELPPDSGSPWLIPRGKSSLSLLVRANLFSNRLSDYGYRVGTGPLVWNRHKSQFSIDEVVGTYPVIWAESVQQNGTFVWSSAKRQHLPWFLPTERDQWVITRASCVLVQRTTAKEQHRRLIAAELPIDFIKKHRGVIVENHLNMILPTIRAPRISPRLIAFLLNNQTIDSIFRCISGSVAVSAFELESIPLPPMKDALVLQGMLFGGASETDMREAVAAVYKGEPIIASAIA